MRVDSEISVLLSQLGWALPVVLVCIAIAVVAMMRRDAGLWWKLVVAGAATLACGQLLSAFGTFVVYSLRNGYRLSWLVSIPSLLLYLIGIGLLGAGAVVGRRAPTTTP